MLPSKALLLTLLHTKTCQFYLTLSTDALYPYQTVSDALQ